MYSHVPTDDLVEALLVLMRPLWKSAGDHLEEKERKEHAKKRDAKRSFKPSKGLTDLREPMNAEYVFVARSTLSQ